MPTDLERKPKQKTTSASVTQKAIDKAVAKALEEQKKEYEEKMSQIGTEYFTCPMCGKLKKRSEFYKSSDSLMRSGITSICKECAKDIAFSKDPLTGETKNPTKASVINSMLYVNRPFYQSLWESSLLEASNPNLDKIKTNVFSAYIKNVAMPQFKNQTFLDSDLFGNMNPIIMDTDNKPMDKDIQEMYEKNRRTVLRMLSYDPFEHSPMSEKPLLYSKLVNYFDDSVREDGLKLEAVIEIVQTFKDVKSINDAIEQAKVNLGNSPQAIGTLKQLAETKSKMIKSALDLAKDNGISVNYNNKKSKGAGTLSGLLKEMSEMNLDDIEINTFNYETGLAMSEIEQHSFENQMKQLNPDENDWEREVVHQRQLLFQLQKERDNAVECARLLKKENKDLKSYMQDNGIIDENCEVVG